MPLPPGLDQLPSLFSADGMHAYIEKHYGAKAGKLAGTTVVASILLLCFVFFVWWVGRRWHSLAERPGRYRRSISGYPAAS